MNMVGKIADRLLEAVAPKATAAANDCRPTGKTCKFCSCYGSRASYRQWWSCTDGSVFCHNVCEIITVC